MQDLIEQLTKQKRSEAEVTIKGFFSSSASWLICVYIYYIEAEFEFDFRLEIGVEFAKMINLRKYSIYHTAFRVTE